MEKQVLFDFPLNISMTELLLKLKLEPGFCEEPLINTLLSEALKIARPKAAFAAVQKELFLDFALGAGGEEEKEFLGRIFEGAAVLYPFAATCGEELDFWASLKTDTFESYICGCIKDTALDKCAEYTFNRVLPELPQGKFLSVLCPGSLPRWPIGTGQTEVFHFLEDTSEKTGIRLNESFLMTPLKSLSGIYFAADAPINRCSLCFNGKCGEREAAYITDITFC